jgi:hypothetical protein
LNLISLIFLAAPVKNDEPRPVASLWVVGNLDSNTGMSAVVAALGLLVCIFSDMTQRPTGFLTSRVFNR